MSSNRVWAAAALLVLAGVSACSRGSSLSDEIVTDVAEPDVVYVPTPQDVVDTMLHLARVQKDDVVFDLGCGDGRVVVTAAKKYGCLAVGYDIDPARVKESRANVRKDRVERLARIEQKDVFTLDLSGANVIFLYLLPELNVRLIPQLDKLKPGTRIVSHDFDMKGVRPDAVLLTRSKEDDSTHRVYLWTVPLRKQLANEGSEEDDEEAPEGWEEDMESDSEGARAPAVPLPGRRAAS